MRRLPEVVMVLGFISAIATYVFFPTPQRAEPTDKVEAALKARGCEVTNDRVGNHALPVYTCPDGSFVSPFDVPRWQR